MRLCIVCCLRCRTYVQHAGTGTTFPAGRRHASGALRRCDQRAATAHPCRTGGRTSMKTPPLSFPIRLPDALQAEALRLLGASRSAINQLLLALWPELDRFATERTGPAWKQVEQYAARRSGHGNRQERGVLEQAGRILRAQASRKQVFQTILPLLSAGLIRPAKGKRPAKKDYRLIREQVRALRAEQQEAGEEADAYVAMTNLLEQACNFYLKTGPSLPPT